MSTNRRDGSMSASRKPTARMPAKTTLAPPMRLYSEVPIAVWCGSRVRNDWSRTSQTTKSPRPMNGSGTSIDGAVGSMRKVIVVAVATAAPTTKVSLTARRRWYLLRQMRADSTVSPVPGRVSSPSSRRTLGLNAPLPSRAVRTLLTAASQVSGLIGDAPPRGRAGSGRLFSRVPPGVGYWVGFLFGCEDDSSSR